MENVHILIVEDNVIVAEDIRIKLGHMGFKDAAIATSCEKAIKAAETQTPDLALMDINLGGKKSGIDAAIELRRKHQVPIVYLTAYADDATIERAKITEPYGYLVKPFEDSELKSTIKIALYKQQADKKIRESQQWLKTTLHSIGDGVIATDERGSVTFMNPVAESLTGWTSGDAAGKAIKEIFRIVNESTLQEVESPVECVFREGIVVGLANHTLLVTRNGKMIPIADSGAPIKNEKGDIIGAVLVFRDQSEERTRQKAIEESREQLAMVLLGSQLGFWDWNIPTGKVVRNERWAEMLGYTLSEIDFTVNSWETLIHLDDRAAAWKSLNDHLAGTTPMHSAEYRMRCKDGQWKWISDKAKIVAHGPDGKAVRMSGTHQDITERKLIEAERELLIACIEQSGDMTIITDKTGVIQYVNKAFEKETGYARAEAIGQTPRILKSGKQDEAFYSQLWSTISSGSNFEGRIINRRKDGTLYTEFATISPVFDGAGNIVNYVGVKRDITKHLEIEERLYQAQKMESIGQLAGGVAHDYNNALSVILGFTEMVMDKVDPTGPLYSDLQEVYDAARRSADVTRQLLAFARKQTVMPRVLDLNETVGGMLKMLQHLIGEDIKLAWQPGANLWRVKIDPSQVDQILANLCVNARHAIRGVGKIVIETDNVQIDKVYCSNHAELVPGNYVLLMLSDSGCGISKSDQKKIFEPFFTTKGVGEGTGLGLATVYGIVKQNNGFISVYSEPEQGTTFKIFLPHNAEGEKDLGDRSCEVVPPRGNGETVLIVEDEVSTLKLAKRILAGLGYTILDAVTTEQALNLAKDHQGKIQLLLTDVIMPEMNGRDLADLLRIICPGIRVLFMSGYTADIITRQGVLANGLNFIQKPFSIKELAVKVREELDKVPAAGENRS
ncbi:MAG: PAS domain S-box protein [Pseudomonadota bacterium]